MLVAVLLALAGGIVVGAVVATIMHRRVDAARPAAIAHEAANSTGSSVRDAVDRLEIGVVMVDGAGNATYRNTAASKLNGTHTGLIVDDHLNQLIQVIRTGREASREVELYGPPRQVLSIAVKPLPRGGAVATIQDVSERALTDAMRKDFVANISHELKTPVGAIAVLAETLDAEDDPAVTARLSGRLVDEAHRAVRTIDDLLELSRIESGRANVELVELADVVALAVARGRSIAADRDIDIVPLEVGTTLRLQADRQQLVSALGNLVENAVKFSSDGATVQIRTRRSDAWLELMVADEGVGIPERDLDRVFERFYRVDKARARDTGGTGLGLAIVRHVARNHGGDVMVQSQEGEGSTFVIRLPARLVIPPGDDTTTDADTTATTPDPAFVNSGEDGDE